MTAKLLSLFSMLMLLNLSLANAADKPKYKAYDWDQERERMEIPEKYKDESALFLKDFKGYEYYYNSKGELNLYSVEHKIIWVNSDDAIEGLNKVVVPLWNVLDIVQLKARAIKKNGEIVMLDKSNIKEINDEETGGNYKIFAIEGVEVGSEIEYFYILKKEASSGLRGARDYFQYSIPSLNATFELISPENLEFLVKSYNGLPEVIKTEDEEHRYVKVEGKDIPTLKKESFAMYDANIMRVDYKLGYNHSRSSQELYDWQDASAQIYENIYDREKEEEKAVAGLYKKMKIKKSLSLDDKIKQIEDYLKTNFSIQAGYANDYYQLDKTIERKFSNERGMIRLYAALLNKAEISHQLVLTSDRSEARFDGKFASWRNLRNYAFYFPETSKYMCITQPDMRYGMIPFYWTHNYGLFIRAGRSDGEAVGKGKVKFIDALPYDISFDNLTIDVAFAPEMDKAKLTLTSSTGGYNSATIQYYYPQLPAEKQAEVAESIIQRYSEEADFTDVTVKNGEKNLSPLETPFIVTGVGESSGFIQKAGPKYLFKLGELIGPQVEMYQEDERQNEVENDFNRLYERTITFSIPEGYLVKNLDDINIDEHYDSDGERIYTFESTYKVTGNNVEVKIVEYYKDINCPQKGFDDFREVVNAAADFNKITLVIEKK